MSRASFLNTYTPTFQRALAYYASNGFTSRALDADDIAFIEHIRETGHVASGSLTYGGSYEEINFWLTPWCSENIGIPRTNWQPSAARKLHEEQDQRRLDAIKAYRAQRKIERKIEARTLERERKKYIKQQARIAEERERRILQAMLADVQWEKANPSRITKDKSFAPYIGELNPRRKSISKSARHYLPFWRRAEIAAKEHDIEQIERERKREQLERLKKRETKRQEREAAATDNTRWGAFLHRHGFAQALEAAHNHDRFMLEQLDAHKRAQAEQEQAKLRAALKDRIVSTVRGSGTRVWTLRELMATCGASDLVAFLDCCNELVGDGYIGRME